MKVFSHSRSRTAMVISAVVLAVAIGGGIVYAQGSEYGQVAASRSIFRCPLNFQNSTMPVRCGCPLVTQQAGPSDFRQSCRCTWASNSTWPRCGCPRMATGNSSTAVACPVLTDTTPTAITPAEQLPQASPHTTPQTPSPTTERPYNRDPTDPPMTPTKRIFKVSQDTPTTIAQPLHDEPIQTPPSNVKKTPPFVPPSPMPANRVL